MVESGIYVFNQYYLDLLKKIKNNAKKYKEKSKTAQTIIKSVKTNYNSFDKNSNENIVFINENIDISLWNDILEKEELSNDFLQECNFKLYKDISISNIAKLIKNNKFIHYNLIILSIFKNEDLTEDDVKLIMEILKNGKLPEDTEIKYKKELLKLLVISKNDASDTFNLGGLEDTSIGKLAKSIVEDLDLSKIKSSIEKKDGNIFSALGDKDSGLGDLLSSVSSKMSSKLANNEINQQDLLQDAMKFAGNMGGASGGKEGMPDLSSMMKMMQGMGLGGMGNMTGAKKGNMKSKMNEMTKMNKQKDRMKEKLSKPDE
jgi:hypothetical protein